MLLPGLALLNSVVDGAYKQSTGDPRLDSHDAQLGTQIPKYLMPSAYNLNVKCVY